MSEKNKYTHLYIKIVICWTYLFWVPAAIISHKNPNWPGIMIFHLLGGIGPLVSSLFITSKKKNWKVFISRIGKATGFSPYLWTLIFSPVIIAVTASLISYNGVLISQDFKTAGITYAIMLFFFGPLPEEIGWRGILFDEISKESIFKAQIITALIWFIWHIPLFFIIGSYQNSIGITSMDFLIWSAGLIMQSIIMGSLYRLTNRSIASAILFHYFVNLAGEMFFKNFRFQIISLFFFSALALAILILSNKVSGITKLEAKNELR